MAATSKVARVPAGLLAVLGALMLALVAAPHAQAGHDTGGTGCGTKTGWLPAGNAYAGGRLVASSSTLNVSMPACTSTVKVHGSFSLIDRWSSDRYGAQVTVEILDAGLHYLWGTTSTETSSTWRSVTFDSPSLYGPKWIRRTVSLSKNGPSTPDVTMALIS